MFILIKELIGKMFSKNETRNSDLDFELWKKEVGIPETISQERKLLLEMENRWCPIANQNCMLDGCIHFKPSKIWFEKTDFGGFYNPNWFMYPPKCKLWTKK